VYASIGSNSLPAIKAFLRGEEFYRRLDLSNARSAYVEAVRLDSAFAPALRKLALTINYLTFTGDSLTDALMQRAIRHNTGLGPRDSLLLLAQSMMSNYTGDRKAQRLFGIMERLANAYEDDAEIWDLYGTVTQNLSFLTWRGPLAFSPQDRRGLFERAIALDSLNVDAVMESAEFSIALGDSAAAKVRSDQCLRAAPPSPSRTSCALFLAFLNHPHDAATLALLDTSSPWAQTQVYGAFYDLPDSAETAIAIARRLFDDAAQGQKIEANLFNPGPRLAGALAIHGRLREAWALVSPREYREYDGLAGQIAALNGIPSDSIMALLRRSTTVFDNREVCVMWWLLAREDTTMLRETRRLATSIMRMPSTSADLRYNLAYYDTIAKAHLTLARGDTNVVLPTVFAIPDSVYPVCAGLVWRFSDARLLAAKGSLEEASRWLAPTPMFFGWMGAFEVMWRLERARVAERMGKRAQAIADYWYVAHMWQHADSVLLPYVAESKRALERLLPDR
jgi:serine/threonine-protein kinase